MIVAALEMKRAGPLLSFEVVFVRLLLRTGLLAYWKRIQPGSAGAGQVGGSRKRRTGCELGREPTALLPDKLQVDFAAD